MNILVVDDEPHFARDVAQALAATFAARVDVASCGTSALKTLATGEYDAALLDRNLPLAGPSGIELCRVARSSFPDMGLIVVTASDRWTSALEAFEAGA